MELKPCPFCGGKGETHKRRTSCRFYTTSKKAIPRNGVFYREIKYQDGATRYEYFKNEWGAWCSDTSCIGRVGKVFPSEEEAIEAWNRRVGEGEKE